MRRNTGRTLTEYIALLRIRDALVLGSVDDFGLKLPLEEFRQLHSSLRIAILGPPVFHLGRRRDKWDRAVHEVPDGSATLLAIDAYQRWESCYWILFDRKDEGRDKEILRHQQMKYDEAVRTRNID